MEITDIFGMFDGYDFSDLAGIQNFLDLSPQGGIAQNMADGDFSAWGIVSLSSPVPDVCGGSDGTCGLFRQPEAAAADLHFFCSLLCLRGWRVGSKSAWGTGTDAGQRNFLFRL